ncbi:MAG: hypothetical protein AAFN77_04060 [Planctomycetota bacterium]
MSAIPIVAICVVFGGGFIAIIAVTAIRAGAALNQQKMQIDAKLKMLERGLTVDEIERLLGIQLAQYDSSHDMTKELAEFRDDRNQPRFREPSPPVKT